MTLRDVTYTFLDGGRNAAIFVTGKASGAAPLAIVFVHWYGPEADLEPHAVYSRCD